MGKTPEDLEKSRQRRAEVIKIWGDVPTSVWNVDYSWGKSTIEFGHKQQEVAEEKHKKMKYNLKTFETQNGKTVTFNEQLDAFSMSSQNVRGKSGGLSTFPPDLCRKIVTYYSEEGETILDPCCGHASRLETVHKLNRHYIGYDVCHEYILFCEEVKKKITENQLFPSPYSITIREQSSEKMVEEDNSIDLVMTSPPYWCHTPETEIITESEIKQIKDLKKGDRVYTHKARYQKVIGVSFKKINENIIKIFTFGNQLPISVTKEHRLYAIKKKNCPYYAKKQSYACKPDCAYLRNGTNIKHKCILAYKNYVPNWIKASSLVKKDYLIYPIDKKIKNISFIKISSFVSGLKVIKKRILLNNNQYGNSSIKDKIYLTKDFLRLCGYFLAEGSCRKSAITFTFHKKEKYFINDVKNIFKKLWNIKGKKIIQENVCHLKFYKTPLASLFKNLFGKYSYNRHIPIFLMRLPHKKQLSLVEGFYYGDGCKVRRSGYVFVSTSGILIEQLKQILLRNNMIFNIGKIKRVDAKYFYDRFVARHNIYSLSTTAKTEIKKFSALIEYKKLKIKRNKIQIGKPYSFILNGYLYIPIRKIENKKYTGKVYNCKIERDNSFTLSNCSSHNCLEYYDDHPQQLGYKKTYEEFLSGLSRILSESYRVLKPERHCIFNVNDFRKDGKFYMYHAHTANIMQKVGFKLADIIVIVWQSAIGAAFADQVWSRKVTAKKHEYLIVAKKE